MTDHPVHHTFRVHPQAAHRHVAGEIFVVTDDRAFHRIRVRTAVEVFLSLATGPKSRDYLVSVLCQRFQVEAAQAARDLDVFLADMVERRLVCAETTTGDKAA
jgi:hypothetical protein